MMEPLLFMIFSTIETFSLYFLIMSLFRYQWQDYVWQSLFVILLLNLQSYLMRKEFDMANFSSLTLVIILIVFFSAVVKMPIIMSIIASITGFITFALIQTVILFTMFGSLERVESDPQLGYMLQLVTAIFNIVVFRLLYVKGKGFTFDIEKLRLKTEDMILTILIIAFFLGSSILLYYIASYTYILFFVPMLAFLLFYSKKKGNEIDY